MYRDNDLWSAFRLDRNQPWRETAGRFMSVVARLKAGTTLAAARAEMRAIGGRLAATYTFNKNTSVALVPLREELTGQVHSSLLIVYGAVGLLLSIACFNVANLLLARAASRRREIAIRTSLDAGRVAIIRQLLVESLLLAVAGGALGIAVARWSLETLHAFAPADLLRVSELSAVIGQPRGGTGIQSRHAGATDERAAVRHHSRRDAGIFPHAAHSRRARTRVHGGR